MLIFSNYSKSFENIHISQPVVDINLEDTNKIIVRYPKFKRITHLILSFDAENLFLNSKSAYGYSFNFEEVLSNIENQTQNGYFVVGVTSNKSRKKQYNPYPRTQNINHAVEHLNSLINIYVPSILSDYDVDVNSVKKRLNNGRLVYLLPKNQDNNAQLKIAKKAIKDFVTDVEPVSNQVVIKTTTAAAQVIADSVDNLYIEEIIGSIAGDNVVLIITPSEVKAKKVAEIINNNLQ